MDLTEWASDWMLGGFVCPVTATASVWREIRAIPPRGQGIQSVRGRAHDVLWMAALAARDGGRGVTFVVRMDVGRTKWQQYRVVRSDEAPGGCVTILKAGEE